MRPRGGRPHHLHLHEEITLKKLTEQSLYFPLVTSGLPSGIVALVLPAVEAVSERAASDDGRRGGRRCAAGRRTLLGAPPREYVDRDGHHRQADEGGHDGAHHGDPAG